MLGYQREKCANYLLLKDDVGKGKPSTRDLPPQGFTFGKTEVRDLEGVGKVVTSWKFHDQSKSLKPDRDFRKLNRLGLKQGALTAKDVASYRKGADARLPEPKAKPNVLISLPDDQFTYGKPLKPSTPIKGVISNYYGEVAEYDKILKYEDLAKEKVPVKAPPIKPTKASDVRDKTIRAQLEETKHASKEMFKMHKFKKVDKRTDTCLKKSQ